MWMASFAADGRTDVLVIGAGVSGLTTAIRLAEAGLSVRVVSADDPQHTTSAAAGASWGPYMLNDDRALHWCEVSRLALEEIALDHLSGVRLVSGLEAAAEPTEPPSWAVGVRDFRRCEAHELPGGYVSGWCYTIPLVDMPRYLRYLTRRLASAGTSVEIGVVRSFAEVAAAARVLVNCSGLGARTLVPDEGVYPKRGQVVVVNNPGIETFFQDTAESDDLTYYLPHGDHVVLGGSAVEGTSLLPDPDRAAAIVDRCVAVEPLLAGAEIIGHRVGLRPWRPEVRVERDAVDGVPLIHNYGHGGSGVTLSWGCADEVLALTGLAPTEHNRPRWT